MRRSTTKCGESSELLKKPFLELKNSRAFWTKKRRSLLSKWKITRKILTLKLLSWKTSPPLSNSTPILSDSKK
jgi:hypothetical protein